jgi:hypothetical protein
MSNERMSDEQLSDESKTIAPDSSPPHPLVDRLAVCRPYFSDLTT